MGRPSRNHPDTDRRSAEAKTLALMLITTLGVHRMLLAIADALASLGPQFQKAAEDVEAITGHAPMTAGEEADYLAAPSSQFCSICCIGHGNEKGICERHGKKVRGCWDGDTLLPLPWPHPDADPKADTQLLVERRDARQAPRPLEWGETPWDEMPRAELVRETARFYTALQAAASVVRMQREREGRTPFWSIQGSGGKALAKIEHVLRPYDGNDKRRENIYRAYFRYAVDLLFPGVAGVGANWHICDACGGLSGGFWNEPAPEECPDCAHKGNHGRPMRKLEWRDIAPKRAEDEVFRRASEACTSAGYGASVEKLKCMRLDELQMFNAALVHKLRNVLLDEDHRNQIEHLGVLADAIRSLAVLIELKHAAR